MRSVTEGHDPAGQIDAPYLGGLTPADLTYMHLAGLGLLSELVEAVLYGPAS